MSVVDVRGIVLCLVLAALAGCQRQDVPTHGRPENALSHDEVLIEHEDFVPELVQHFLHFAPRICLK